MHHFVSNKSLIVGLLFLAVSFVSPLEATATVTIEHGDSAVVHWLVTGSPTCNRTVTGSPGAPVDTTQWVGIAASAGSLLVGPFSKAGNNGSGAVFTFTCTAGSESSSDTVTVECPASSPRWNGSACVLPAPIITTNAATLVTTTGATLNGSGNPNGISTTGYFRYSTTNPGACNNTFGTRSPSSGGDALGSGSSAVAFANPVTGLPGETTYYFCAIGINVNSQLGFGSVMSFKTLALPEATTNAASATTSTSIMLNGVGDPNSFAATATFRYGTTNLACASLPTSVTATVPASGLLGSLTAPVSFSYNLTGLSPNTTYYYCARVSNVAGADYGIVRMIKTLPTPSPSVTTIDATSITTTSATINGLGNPNGYATNSSFHWGTSNAACNLLPSSNVGSPSALGAGTGNVNFSRNLTGLTANTTYYFCARGQNAHGWGNGNVLTFRTLAAPPPPAPPTVSTVAATNITTNSATINGLGNPNGYATEAKFRWGPTNAACSSLLTFALATTPPSGALGNGITNLNFSVGISGLTANTTYYFCARGQSAHGWGNGNVLTFRTLAVAPPSGPPIFTTDSAINVTQTTATIQGRGNPNGVSTNGHFHWSSTNAACHLLTNSNLNTALGAGTSDVPMSYYLSSLAPNTTYYYCTHGSNASSEWGSGSVLNFTTGAAWLNPAVVWATVNGASSATIKSGETFTLAMNSNFAWNNSCTWSRYTDGTRDWDYTDIPDADDGPMGTSYGPASFAWPGPRTYRWNFYCWNGDGGSGASVDLTILPPEPVIQVDGITNFPDTIVGNQSTRTFTVTNVGSAGSMLTGVVTPTSGAEFYCIAGCSYANLSPVSPGHSVTVAFAPSVVGARSGNVDFSGGGGVTKTMTGNGLTPILVVPDPLDFGDVVVTRKKTLQLNITNRSSSDITNPFSVTDITDSDVFICDAGCTPPATLAAGASRILTVSFIPDPLWDIVTPTSTVAHLIGVGRTEEFTITGRGVPPVWSVVEE